MCTISPHSDQSRLQVYSDSRKSDADGKRRGEEGETYGTNGQLRTSEQ